MERIIDNGIIQSRAVILEEQAQEDVHAGRPQHAPTEATRGFVTVMRGYRIPPNRIAAAIGIAQSTLYVHYQHELENAETLVDAEVLTAWMKLIKKADPLTVNRYMERRFSLSDDAGAIASALPNVTVIDNIPDEHPAIAPPNAAE